MVNVDMRKHVVRIFIFRGSDRLVVRQTVLKGKNYVTEKLPDGRECQEFVSMGSDKQIADAVRKGLKGLLRPPSK